MLREAVNRHIELYQSMGFKYRVQAYALRSFADFAEQRSEEFVRADSVLEWAASAPSIRQRHDRLRTVYRLACALNAEDQRHEVPPTAVFGGEPRRPRSCHIFTQDEIERLLRAASELAPRGSIRPITYTTLVSLIACTGLRILSHSGPIDRFARRSWTDGLSASRSQTHVRGAVAGAMPK